MCEEDLPKWNRSLVEEVIEVLESSQSQTAEAISRLRNYLAVNPGRPTIGPDSEIEPEDAGSMASHSALDCAETRSSCSIVQVPAASPAATAGVVPSVM
jgi:hypothetical protein